MVNFSHYALHFAQFTYLVNAYEKRKQQDQNYLLPFRSPIQSSKITLPITMPDSLAVNLIGVGNTQTLATVEPFTFDAFNRNNRQGEAEAPVHQQVEFILMSS